MWQLRGLQMRRWLVGARGVIGVATLAALLIGALGTRSFIVHAVPGGAATPHGDQLTVPMRNILAEGKWFQLSHYGNRIPTVDARIKALRQAARLPSFLPSAPAPNGPTWDREAASSAFLPRSASVWAPLGPQPINSATCGGVNCPYGPYGLNSGRITAIAVNPNNSNDVWLGAADGGLWHSTDGGKDWAPMTDGQATLAIGAITIDAKSGNPYTIYIGTGEANNNGDAYWGIGILKSADGGQTWTQLGANQFGRLGIARIAVDPYNSSNLLVAVGPDFTNSNPSTSGLAASLGLWRSTDGGSTWSQPPVPNGAAGPASDVVFDPAHAGVAWAGLNGRVCKSTNNGATWDTGMANYGFLLGGAERVSLGISNTGLRIYAVMTSAGLDGFGTPGALVSDAVIVSTDGGANWSPMSAPSLMATDHGEYQWAYESAIAVDPSDTTGKIAYVGGVDLWKTTDGGSTWTNLTNAFCNSSNPPVNPTPTPPCPAPVHVHPNQHAVVIIPGSTSFFLGNDGGVWSSTSAGVFTNLNGGGLNITQFYGGGIGDVGAHAQLYGGTEGNGEDQYPGGAPSGTALWNEVLGGEEGDTLVDYTDNSVIYSEFPFGVLLVSRNGGSLWTSAEANHGVQGFPGTTNFIMPVIMSPNNHNELLIGTDRVFRTTDGTSTWSAISPPLDQYACGPSTCTRPLSALAVASSNENYIYVGDNAGHVFMTANGTAGTPTWTQLTILGSTGGMVTGLAVDPTNSAIVYASFASFASGSGQHIFKSTNTGATWTDISASLPNIPFEGVLVVPIYSGLNYIIAGSDAGVFVSADAGTTWHQLGSGLPNAAVDQIFTNHSGSLLFVATHGRGMWELPI